MNKNYSLRDIGIALNRSASTISREIKKNSVKGEYIPAKAQHKAYVKRLNASFRGKSIVRNLDLRNFVEEKLLDGHTPGAISGRIKHQEDSLPNVSKDTIYRFFKKSLWENNRIKTAKEKTPNKAQE